MPSPHRENHDSYLVNYLRTGDATFIGVGHELEGQRKDGTLFPMELSIGEVRLGERRLFTELVRDISERRELEQAVASAGEQERTRIARELHDGLGQQLGGLLFLMNGLHRDLQSANEPHAETAGELSKELATALAQARNLAHELYAVIAVALRAQSRADCVDDRKLSHRPNVALDAKLPLHRQRLAASGI